MATLTTSSSQRRDRWLALIMLPLFGAILIGAFMYMMTFAAGPRPLFHQPSRSDTGFGVNGWSPTPALEDEQGTVVFTDLELNYAVLFITGDPVHGGASFATSADTEQATLMAASPWEKTVQPLENRLVVVFEDGTQKEFTLPPGGARWFLAQLPREEEINVVDELEKVIDADTKKTIVDLSITAKADAKKKHEEELEAQASPVEEEPAEKE